MQNYVAIYIVSKILPVNKSERSNGENGCSIDPGSAGTGSQSKLAYSSEWLIVLSA